MTKHQGGQSPLAPPALSSSYLGAHYDPQLDSGSSAYPQSHLPTSVTQSAPYWPHHHHQAQLFAQQPAPRLEKPAAATRDHLNRPPLLHMDKLIPAPGPAADPRRPQDYHQTPPQLASSRLDQAEGNDRDSWDSDHREKKTKEGAGRKKNYQRYAKPPYSYLAMIAMVIQNSPEKKLTLSEILKEISTLFPFFKGNYKGWRDSVRHNLSSYDCFVKVLKDPGKPQGKGNFWSVELSRVPLELLKRQNTAVARQEETVFAQDLAPYILHGQPLKPEAETLPINPPIIIPLPPLASRVPSPPQDDPFRPKLDSSFAIDSLLHSLRPPSAAGEAERASRDFWGSVLPPRPSPPQRYTPSTCSTSASSASPASSSSDEDWRGLPRSGKRMPPYGETGSDGYDDCRPPLHKTARRTVAAPPWELPTSYAKYTPPNAVAPPSMRFNGSPLMPLHGGIPLYSYGGTPVAPGHFLSHAYWPILPSGRVSLQTPPLIMDLDSMLQSVPPNKSVFDAMAGPHHQSHQNPHHQPHYALPSASPLNMTSLLHY